MPTLKDEYYTYDSVNRLTVSQRGDLNTAKDAISGTAAREEDWTLDPTGNWSGYAQLTSGTTDLSQTRTHNEVNEVTAASSWATPAHDLAGNMTTVPKPSSLANSLTLLYDAWNRVVQVTDSATILAKYVYDGEGRRVLKHIDSDSPGSADGIDRYEHHYYVGTQLAETRNTDTVATAPESLTPKDQWVWSPRYIDAAILRDEGTDADGQCDDARVYFLNDANMNVTTLVDTSGDAVERYVYDPYGAVTIYNADWTATRSSSSYANATLYTGRYLDAESGLYFYRARYYSAELGRFISRDPVQDAPNFYCYVASNPLIYVDPSGLKHLGEKWDVPDFFWWYYFGNAQDVPLDRIGLFKTVVAGH